MTRIQNSNIQIQNSRITKKINFTNVISVTLYIILTFP